MAINIYQKESELLPETFFVQNFASRMPIFGECLLVKDIKGAILGVVEVIGIDNDVYAVKLVYE